MIPSCHSAGTRPVFHIRANREWREMLTGSSAYLSSSGWIPSEPAARPFFNFRIARLISPNVGASSGTVRSGMAQAASESRSGHYWQVDGSMCSGNESASTPWFPELNGMADRCPATLGHHRRCLSDAVRDLWLSSWLCTTLGVHCASLTPSSASSAGHV